MWFKKIACLVTAAFCLVSFGGTAAASGMGQPVRIGIREGTDIVDCLRERVSYNRKRMNIHEFANYR